MSKPWLAALLRATIISAAVGVQALPARADQDAQREALARIAYELQRLEQIAGDSAKTQEQGGRTTFRFDWLVSDLRLVRRGIEDHGDAERQPRPIPPLRGDYRP